MKLFRIPLTTSIIIFVINIITYSQPFSIIVESGIREPFIELGVTDAPVDYFSLINGTNVNGQLFGLINGHHESDARGALVLMASTSESNDIINTSPLMVFDSRISPTRYQLNNGDHKSLTNRILYGWNNAGIPKMVLSASGSLGIGTTDPSGKLDVYGDIYQNGSLIHSDRRFKTKIERIKNPLKLITRLNGVSYEFKSSHINERNFLEKTHLGVIAQEVEMVLPELVKKKKDGYKAVNYDGLIPVLIEGIKEQQKVIENLEEKADEIDNIKLIVQSQQQEIDELKFLIDKLIKVKQDKREGDYQNLSNQKPKLSQNQPNPFSVDTMVEYFVPHNIQHAIIQVTSVDGKVLDTLKIQKKGVGQINIKSNTYSSGTYYYSLVLDGKIINTKRMVLTR